MFGERRIAIDMIIFGSIIGVGTFAQTVPCAALRLCLRLGENVTEVLSDI